MTGGSSCAFALVSTLMWTGVAPSWAQSNAPPAADAKKKGVYERDVVEVAPAKPVTLLAVDNRLGDVRIQGHDSDKVVISAFKRARDKQTLERLKVTLVPGNAGPVRIATSLSTGREARPIPSGSVKVDLHILAPRSARVDARVWNGHLEVISMENGAELSSNRGRIGVKNASGAITTHSTAGEQIFEEIFGSLDAQSIAGRMDMAIVRGRRLHARVHDGRIDGRKVRVHELSLRTTKGDIRLRAQALAGGRYEIGTFSGNIEVEFVSSAPLDIRARSVRGKVRVPKKMAARMGERGRYVAAASAGKGTHAVISLRSRVGTIQLATIAR